jgi:hypothetical protein
VLGAKERVVWRSRKALEERSSSCHALDEERQRLIIEPVPPASLLAVLDALEPLEEALPAVPDLPIDDVDL